MSAGLAQPIHRSKLVLRNTEQVCGDLWSRQLQQDIIDLILERLGVRDHLRFGAVCTSWRAAVARSMATAVLEFPLLLHRDSPPYKDDYLFSSLIKDRYYSINPGYTKGSRVVGVSEGGGWLVMEKYSGWCPSLSGERQMEKITRHFLLNPVTGKQFILPPQSTISGTHGDDPYFFGCIVASSEPTNSNCLVAGLCRSGFSLAFCRFTDTKWTLLNQDDEVKDFKFMSIIFCDGKLYASTAHFEEFVVVFDLRQEIENGVYKSQKIVMAAPSPIWYRLREVRQEGVLYSFYRTFYSLAADLVSRELLLILFHVKVLSKEHPQAHNYCVEKLEVISFHVYKMDTVDDHISRWMEVIDLGDRLLFLGNCGCFFIPTKAFGESTPGNCIYYAFELDDCSEVGKFHLREQTIIQCPPRPPPINRTCATHAHGWFVPALT